MEQEMQHLRDMNVARDNGVKLLTALCQKQEDVVLEVLQSNRVDWEAADSNGMTPLHHAARWGHVAFVSRILQCKPDLANRVTPDGGLFPQKPIRTHNLNPHKEVHRVPL